MRAAQHPGDGLLAARLRQQGRAAVPQVRDARLLRAWFGPTVVRGRLKWSRPYLGMGAGDPLRQQHQTRYWNDQSDTSHGDDWDFIIIHGSTRWFANNVTAEDRGRMVHAGFVTSRKALRGAVRGRKPARSTFAGSVATSQRPADRAGVHVNAIGSGDMCRGRNMYTIARSVRWRPPAYDPARNATWLYSHRRADQACMIGARPDLTNLRPVPAADIRS